MESRDKINEMSDCSPRKSAHGTYVEVQAPRKLGQIGDVWPVSVP